MSELEFKDSLLKLDILLEMINIKSKNIDAEVELLDKTIVEVEKIIEETAKVGTH